ncbi:ATP-binding protein [Pseudomonas abieticivorans]|uniref:ATP-binding protein n=1 Tax=Pseudomonas abieticivorans TaxID=2931382 RepID=UPI0020C0019A|nr:ATP-binding protein [Pseudomonas sp. PIA16]
MSTRGEVALITLDLAGDVMDISAGTEHWLGWRADELRRGPASRVLSADRPLPAVLQQALAAGQLTVQGCCRCGDGRQVPVLIELLAWRDGNGLAQGFSLLLQGSGALPVVLPAPPENELGLRLALADLTHRISESADPVELAYNACEIIGRALGVSRVGYGLIDPLAETITIERDWNAPGIKTIAGVLNFREYGSYIDDLKRGNTVFVSNADHDPRTASTSDSLKAISAHAFINMPVHEEGGLVALLYLNHAHPRDWPEGDIAFVREVAARIRTAEARRRAEINLLVLTDSLEQQVESRTQALMATEEALRQAQKMEAVGQLTGGVAHDFNNLLTVIRSSIDLLARPDLPEARRKRYVEAISSTVSRAARLTGQLLAFARRQALQPQVFDVAASVAALREMIGTLAGSRISITVQVPQAPCFILADPSQFDTALINMAVNARDAMNGQGRLTLSLSAVNGIPRHPLEAERAGDFIAVSVSDTGTGIEPATLTKVFEPFFTTKPFGQGTGLGLSQVFGFAKQSGGDVLVDSDVGSGTTFTLYLPMASAPQAPLVLATSAQVAPRLPGTARVLVVEDNLDVGAFASETLQELGYTSVWVKCAAEALAELADNAQRYSVVFSDVVMPGISGLELAKSVRALYPSLPVVLTSGYSHVLAQQGTGGFDLLHKPYSVEELGRVLAAAIAQPPVMPSHDSQE